MSEADLELQATLARRMRQACQVLESDRGIDINSANITLHQRTQRNHFVPRSYLKRWAGSDGKLFSYRILVPHPNCPVWKLHSAKSIAYHEHLYTRARVGGEADEIERWFDNEFESPSEDSIQKVVDDKILSTGDWEKLMRFLAAQNMRTPARLMENLKLWQETLPKIDEMLADVVRECVATKRGGAALPLRQNSYSELFPGRVIIDKNAALAEMRFEIDVGLELWLFYLKQSIIEECNLLLEHKWTILKSPKGMQWLTSDDPVVRLNYYNPDKYDFGGGSNSKSNEIMLPLGPKHLMYTKIGSNVPSKGMRIPRELALSLQRFTVEHAHRYVFGRSSDTNVSTWRPRVMDKKIYDSEAEQWKNWHESQAAFEADP